MGPKAKALEKQAQVQEERDKRAAEETERKASAEWAEGAKVSKKQKDAEEKEAERLRKVGEMASLLAAEEESLASVVKKVVKPRKKGKDDFDLLDAALKAQPKTKAQKEAEEKKKLDEERKRKEAEAAEQKQLRLKADEEARRKALARGIVLNHTDDLFVPINNRLDEEDESFEGSATGLDAALGVLSVGGKAEDNTTRRQKALHTAYYDRMLPTMREELPGLKLSQYKERIFDAWKVSPENPQNSSR